MGDIRTLVDWLTDGARSGSMSEDVLAELCRRMVDAGIPLWRAAVFVNTLHPDVIGRAFFWRVDTGIKVTEAGYDLLETAEYQSSPVVAVYGSRQPLRRHLADSQCPDDFPVLKELRAEGATDYAAFPLAFTDGTIHVATWTTRQPGGFTPQQYADLEAITAPLTRVAEIRALRRTATNLLNTYVGRQAGERILAGKIRRGHVEAIHAVLWLSDMRGFTARSERLPPQELIDLLNRYFDCQVPTIHSHGGEVLKFIGDGLLAIFPLNGDGGDAGEVCRRALVSAREAEAAIAALETPAGINHEAVRFGLALHVGQVMYGNIGGGNRLDFTCIGPAVNLAARMEKRAASLGRTIVASAEFAAHAPGEFVSLGEFAVAGFSAPQMVFGLADPAPEGGVARTARVRLVRATRRNN
jgi:adenylate cyclase